MTVRCVCFVEMIRRPPRSPLFPYTALCRAAAERDQGDQQHRRADQDRIGGGEGLELAAEVDEDRRDRQDRKSTRLNSSHASISYAVFCLKKKAWRRLPRTSPSTMLGRGHVP